MAWSSTRCVGGQANFADTTLTHIRFRAAHRANPHPSGPTERLNGEIRRLTDVVSTFPTRRPPSA
ncbi:transposase [Roseomonas sp. HJA6]|uniref:Transposase n=1 Tax=Roseomonas alba TaxID=2846776 RepID=A0ABS7AGG2_9PROT|nr:transposase [Neoroseomonas alba]